MVKQTSITSGQKFQPHQIVGLDCQEQRLYSEIIQIVTGKQRCWVRPLLLVTTNSQRDQELESYFDLRQTADLVWPLGLFRPALDTEVIPLLQQLSIFDGSPKDNQEAHREFRQFINRVWQAQLNHEDTYN